MTTRTTAAASQRRLDPERQERHVDGRELRGPADELEEERLHGRTRSPEDREPAARHVQDTADGAELLGKRAVVLAREEKASDEEAEPHADGDCQHGRRPLGNRRDVERDEDEDDRSDHVEEAVREDRADDRRPRARPTAHVPRDHGDAGELPDATGQCGVPEQSDAEGREDVPAPRPGRRDRLLDDDVPGLRADDHGEEVDQDGRRDPFPFDGAERPLDRSWIRAAPHGERHEGRNRDEHDEQAPGAASRRSDAHHAAALTASAGTTSRS